MNAFHHRDLRYHSQLHVGSFKKSTCNVHSKATVAKRVERKTTPFPHNTGCVTKPKRPLTAYNLFFQDEQKKLKSLKATKSAKLTENSARLVSHGWESLSPATKSYYFQLAAEEKFRYYNEKSEYDRQMELVEAARSSVQHQPAVDDPEEWKVHPHVHDDCLSPESYSHASIALLASKLDADSIDFLIKALK